MHIWPACLVYNIYGTLNVERTKCPTREVCYRIYDIKFKKKNI